MLRRSVLCLVLLLLAPTAIGAPAPAVVPPIPASAPPTIDARPWPRQYTINGASFSVYRPQLESWANNQLVARAVMTVKTGTTTDASGKSVDQQSYGVVWMKARTETDVGAREVVLTDISFDRVSFPAARDQEAARLALVRQVVPATQLVVSLDEMESALALATNIKATSLAVSYTPPEIIFSFQPAILVSVDGEPAWRKTASEGVERAINSRALLLRYQGAYYVGYAGHWTRAASLSGPWTAAASVAPPLQQAMLAATAANEVPAAKDIPAGIVDAFKNGAFPTVYLRTHPSELLVVNGQPQFASLQGTQLSYVTNTPADVFVDSAGTWYVLISGRWFSGASSNGPWSHVAQGALPADFSKIAADGPKGAVLASIAGTPQAREAMIANAVAQTATVDKTKASFEAKYDGLPKFVPISGTKLSYAANSATPIINVPGASYYALNNGVWFRSEGPAGAWAVTASVPAAIYSIPPSSPVHYVTYVRVYGGSGNNVYVGYTPGYYGTVVADNVVVYGTGYPCNSWVGDVWYGCPATYGYGAALAYGTAVGWAVAFGWGYDYLWYNPWWGPWWGYYPGYYPWAYGGWAAWNTYGRWGNSVVAGTAAAWANPWTGNYGRAGAGGFYNPNTGGRGYGYAGRNFNAYTGTGTAAAGGIRYNPQTGRVVAGQGGAAGNIYTGSAGAAGQRTVVNTNTGQVTREAGGVARGPGGAGAAGAFSTSGAAGNAQGAGYIRYDRATGDVNRGGVVDVNGNIYAGRDGNVYRHDADGWEKAGGNNQFARSQPAAGLDTDRMARDHSFQRQSASGSGCNRGSFSGAGRMGGMRSFGGGGFRRR